MISLVHTFKHSLELKRYFIDRTKDALHDAFRETDFL